MFTVGSKVQIIAGKYDGKQAEIISVSQSKQSVRVILYKSLKTSPTGFIPIRQIIILEHNQNMGPKGEVVSNSSCDNLSNRAEIKPQEHSIDLTPSDHVCNIVGSSRDKPRGATSWKKYWEIKTGEKWPSQCSICPKLFEKCRGIGGHMYIKSKPNLKFILPICTSCNNKRSIDYNAYSPNKTAWTRIVQITTAVPI